MDLETHGIVADSPSAGGQPGELLIAQVRDGDPDACGALYSCTERGIRSMLRHHLGHEDFEGALQDVYLEVFQGIRRGLVRDPTRLGSFLRAVVNARIAEEAATIRPPAKAPRQAEEMRQVLPQLSPGERELLERYLVRKQSADQICREMDVTADQLRLAIARAKRLYAAERQPGVKAIQLTAAV